MTTAQIKAEAAALLAQAEAQQRVNGSLGEYLKALERIEKLRKTILESTEAENKLQAEVNTAVGQAKITAQKKLDVLKEVNDELKKTLKTEEDILATAKKTNLVLAAAGASAVKGFGKLPGLLKNSFGKIKGWGLFEMEKSMKMSTLQMGILGSQSKFYESNIKDISQSTAELGITLTELTKMQADYSLEMGRTVMLSKQSLSAMAQMATATGLGAEGASEMAAFMDAQGLSVEKTRDLMEETMNSSSKMGINGTKTIKNMSTGMKMMNRYNFKGGTEGLAKMAKQVAKMNVSMEMAAGMADKLFDIEGAVDMAAQLQVMGGAWANMADPFKLAYMARNDMGALTEQLGKAAESMVTFNKKTGEMEISSMEMHRLRIISDQTGASIDELAEAGKRAKKATMIKSQVSLDVDDETKEFLASTAEFKNGKATVMIGSSPKLVSQLNDGDKKILAGQMLEKKSLEARAISSQTFDDKLTNLISMVKTSMLPIVEGMNEILGPLVKEIFANDKFQDNLKGLGRDIGEFVKAGAKIVKYVAEVGVALGPKGVLAVMLIPSLISLGISVASFTTSLIPLLGAAGPLVLGLLAVAAASKVGSYVGGKISKSMGNKDTKEGDTSAMWTGAAIAASVAAIALTGGLATPAVIALAAAGGLAGGTVGKVVGDSMNQDSSAVGGATVGRGMNDGIAHGDFSQGRGIIQGGHITPIDNKDDLVAYKPNGPIDKSMKSNGNTKPSTMKIEFGEIRFKFDELKVSNTNGQSVSVELLKDQAFIRSITNMVHAQTEKAINGGVVRG